MALLKTIKHRYAWAQQICFKSNLRKSGTCLNFNHRVKASTLMETLVATVLIVVVFMISSMTMNNMLTSNVKQNTEIAEERLHALAYQYQNKGIKLPYYEDYESWEISIFKAEQGVGGMVTLEAENIKTNTLVTNYLSIED